MSFAGGDEEEWRKRLALTGQWKTPPTPMYAAGGSTPGTTTTTSALPSVPEDSLSHFRTTSLPNQGTSDSVISNSAVVDYTAALQEAYLRGAQAAAALAASQAPVGKNPGSETTSQSAVLPLSSVPNPLLYLSAGNDMGMPSSQLQTQQLGREPLNEPISASESTTAASSTTVIDSSPALFPFVTPIQSPNSVPLTLSAITSSTGAQHRSTMPLQAQSHSLLGDQNPAVRNPQQALPSQAAQTRPLPYPSRAMSMPNMGFNLEEEKRQKRLARNRASARLRRMRKKNLVEAYEVEVGILEKTLESLKKHQWGLQDDSGALIEALSLDRGQQHLTVEERRLASFDILDQQLRFVEMLEDCMREQYVLFHLTRETGELSDLKDALRLSPEQCTRLADSASGWEDDWSALQTVKSSLDAMRNSGWLLSESGNSVVEGFLSIFHKTQISKLLLWSDHNCDSIDDLDFVHASFDPNPASGPVFQFGISNNPDCLLDPSSGKVASEQL